MAGVETAVVIGVEKVVRRERTMRVSVFRPNYLSFRPKNLDLLAQMSDIDPSTFIIVSRFRRALPVCVSHWGFYCSRSRFFRLSSPRLKQTTYKQV